MPLSEANQHAHEKYSRLREPILGSEKNIREMLLLAALGCDSRLQAVQTAFFSTLTRKLMDSALILVSGSDARRERAPILPSKFNTSLEAIVIAEQPIQLARTFQKNVQEQIALSLDIELKPLNSILSAYEGNVHHAWPDRVIHSELVYGNQAWMDEAIQHVFAREWETIRDLRKSLKSARNYFLSVTRTGFSGGDQQFSPGTGTVFFTENRKQFGLKLGPLRTVQTQVLIDELDQGTHVPEKRIDRRIYQIYKDQKGYASLIQEVVEAYQQALHIHQWQYVRKSHGADATVRMTPTQLAGITQPIIAFTEWRKDSPFSDRGTKQAQSRT